MGILVVGVTLTLIPKNARDGQSGQFADACFVEVAGLVGMALQGLVVFAHVLQGAAAHPVLKEVVACPVAQYLGHFVFQCGAVNPCLAGTAAHGVRDDADGAVETVLQLTGEVVADGTEAR